MTSVVNYKPYNHCSVKEYCLNCLGCLHLTRKIFFFVTYWFHSKLFWFLCKSLVYLGSLFTIGNRNKIEVRVRPAVWGRASLHIFSNQTLLTCNNTIALYVNVELWTYAFLCIDYNVQKNRALWYLRPKCWEEYLALFQLKSRKFIKTENWMSCTAKQIPLELWKQKD